ncbi:MAG TPA: cytochrome c biogenesis protein ResB [Rhodocyclaceae bacterium]|nr:cytochrome c biogenesis protein ResB [Rhodocyclaceae bacterium]
MHRTLARQFYELLSSMRFAVSLLTVLSIASVIGTVLKQNEPYNSYLNQFGQFWFPVFEALGLYSVYHASWFLAILAFLVASTSLCIIRQAPGMVKEMKSFRTGAREASLRQFAHKHMTQTALPRSEAAQQVSHYLATQGYKSRSKEQADGLLLAAKAGSWNRMGYLLAHSAIVLICVGGLLDGDLPLKLEMMLGAKQVTSLDKPFGEIGAESRLGPEHWSYRGNVFLPEGKRSNIAVLNVKDGALLQELPFSITLKKFHIEHYSTGMPKRFASDVVITDLQTGAETERTIEVNKPFEYRGVSLYQASFEDGGSKLQLKAHSLLPGSTRISDAQGEVGGNLQLKQGEETLQVEITGFRPFNIENMAQPSESEKNTLAMLNHALGSGAKAPDSKDMKNVGPSFSYKVRDAAGQAREYNNYMVPIEQDGRRFFMTGMRETQADGFRYLRLPADEDDKLDTWLAVRAILTTPGEHALIARRFAAKAMSGRGVSDTMRTRLADTAERTLQLFAESGFEGLGAFIKDSVPENEREKAADVFVRVLQGCTWEAWQLQRERKKLKPLQLTTERADFVRDTVNSISDSFHYGAPAYLALDQFEEVKASVIQATRSPGKAGVYLGCALLVAGVFFMLYVRERRLFVLLKDSGEVLIALSSNRKTMDTDTEFARHQEALESLLNHGNRTS